MFKQCSHKAFFHMTLIPAHTVQNSNKILLRYAHVREMMAR